MSQLAWVRRIASEIPELNEIPLFGNAPAFDWHQFSTLLAAQFGLSQIKIHSKEVKFLEGDELANAGADSTVLAIQINPIGTVYWVLTKENLGVLSEQLLRPSQKPHTSLSEIFQEGFSQFATLKTLETLQSIAPFNELTFQLGGQEKEFEKAYCIDVQIEIEGRSSWGKMVIPSEFKKAWILHFSSIQSDYFPSELAKRTYLTLGVKTGSVILHQDEWESIKPGDFVLLDQGYDALQESGLSLVMLGSTPIFNAKIKSNQIEITDYAFYYEDNMENQDHHSSEKPEKLRAEEGEIVALKELPLYVTVEIAKVKITLEKLMQLTPGNTLELPIDPDQTVSLTVNGQKVGRGELVYLGEKLGVRITEI